MDDDKKCLFNPVDGKSIYRSQLMFRNRKHPVKVALNRDDDKQLVQKDGGMWAHESLISLTLILGKLHLICIIT